MITGPAAKMQNSRGLDNAIDERIYLLQYELAEVKLMLCVESEEQVLQSVER
jgi:hypothetical protein